ncbi:hypothetical protein HK098_000721 [Nowakowskiella sp. JEL0407]|nr:hypothetical protein HK098_000721 [Nowakowskiella sp. JEL0407]
MSNNPRFTVSLNGKSITRPSHSSPHTIDTQLNQYEFREISRSRSTESPDSHSPYQPQTFYNPHTQHTQTYPKTRKIVPISNSQLQNSHSQHTQNSIIRTIDARQQSVQIPQLSQQYKKQQQQGDVRSIINSSLVNPLPPPPFYEYKNQYGDDSYRDTVGLYRDTVNSYSETTDLYGDAGNFDSLGYGDVLKSGDLRAQIISNSAVKSGVKRFVSQKGSESAVDYRDELKKYCEERGERVVCESAETESGQWYATSKNTTTHETIHSIGFHTSEEKALQNVSKITLEILKSPTSKTIQDFFRVCRDEGVAVNLEFRKDEGSFGVVLKFEGRSESVRGRIKGGLGEEWEATVMKCVYKSCSDARSAAISVAYNKLIKLRADGSPHRTNQLTDRSPHQTNRVPDAPPHQQRHPRSTSTSPSLKSTTSSTTTSSSTPSDRKRTRSISPNTKFYTTISQHNLTYKYKTVSAHINNTVKYGACVTVSLKDSKDSKDRESKDEKETKDGESATFFCRWLPDTEEEAKRNCREEAGRCFEYLGSSGSSWMGKGWLKGLEKWTSDNKWRVILEASRKEEEGRKKEKDGNRHEMRTVDGRKDEDGGGKRGREGEGSPVKQKRFALPPKPEHLKPPLASSVPKSGAHDARGVGNDGKLEVSTSMKVNYSGSEKVASPVSLNLENKKKRDDENSLRVNGVDGQVNLVDDDDTTIEVEKGTTTNEESFKIVASLVSLNPENKEKRDDGNSLRVNGVNGQVHLVDDDDTTREVEKGIVEVEKELTTVESFTIVTKPLTTKPVEISDIIMTPVEQILESEVPESKSESEPVCEQEQRASHPSPPNSNSTVPEPMEIEQEETTVITLTNPFTVSNMTTTPVPEPRSPTPIKEQRVTGMGTGTSLLMQSLNSLKTIKAISEDTSLQGLTLPTIDTNNNDINNKNTVQRLQRSWIPTETPNPQIYPLHYAAATCDFSAIRLLVTLESIRQPDNKNRLPIHWLCESTDVIGRTEDLEDIVFKLTGWEEDDHDNGNGSVVSVEILTHMDYQYRNPIAISMMVDARTSCMAKRKRTGEKGLIEPDFGREGPRVTLSTVTQMLMDFMSGMGVVVGVKNSGSLRTCWHGLAESVSDEDQEEFSEVVFVVGVWVSRGELEFAARDVRGETGVDLLRRRVAGDRLVQSVLSVAARSCRE